MIEPAFIKRRRGGSREQGTTLVELLVVMVIMSVVTAMILVTWFALQNAYSSTTIATKQREMAQQGMARMVQEIRDTSGAVGSVPGKGFVVAGPYKVTFYSAFNDPSASRVTTIVGTGDGTGYRPPMGGFYYEDGTLYRWRDTDGSEEGPSAEEGPSEGDRVDVLARNVVNGPDTPIFTYTCINSSNGTPYHSPPGSLTNLATITSVQITLRIDLNPGHSPTYMDLISTAQPRNNRQT